MSVLILIARPILAARCPAMALGMDRELATRPRDLQWHGNLFAFAPLRGAGVTCKQALRPAKSNYYTWR